MKIIKALIQQFIRCLVGMFKGHQKIDFVITTYVLGIPVWEKYHRIECTCGKIFYKQQNVNEEILDT